MCVYSDFRKSSAWLSRYIRVFFHARLGLFCRACIRGREDQHRDGLMMGTNGSKRRGPKIYHPWETEKCAVIKSHHCLFAWPCRAAEV